ncbi:MAG: serine/threonine-protein kinase [Acidobacteriota bacterium]
MQAVRQVIPSMDIGRFVRPRALIRRLRSVRRLLPGILLRVAFSCALALFACRGVLERVELPRVGLEVHALSGAVAGFDVESWSELKTGDLIHAVDGLEVEGEPLRIRLALDALDVGPVALEVERLGEKRTVIGAVTAAAAGDRWAVWLRWAIGCWLLVLSLGVFAWRRHEAVPSARFFALGAALAAHQLSALALAPRPEAALLTERLALALAAGAGAHLALRHPRDLLAARGLGASALAALYAPVLVPAAAFLLLPGAGAGFSFSSRPLAAAVLDASLPLAWIWATFGVAAAAYQLRLASKPPDAAASWTPAASPESAAAPAEEADYEAMVRARALLVALFLGLTPPALLAAARVFEPAAESLIWSFAFVFTLSMMAYAALRRNLIALDRLSATLTAHGATALVLAAAFTGLVMALGELFGGVEAFHSPLAGAAAAGACFMLFQPLYRRLSRFVDFLFRRHSRDRGLEVQVLQGLATAVRARSLGEAFEAAVECLDVLEAEHCELWARGPDGRSLVRLNRRPASARAAQAPPPLQALDGALARSLALGSGGVEAQADRVFDSAGQDALWDLALALAAPIATASERLEGFIAVGRKKNGTPFSRQDRLFLEAVAAHMAIAFDRNWQRSQRIGAYVLRQRLGTGGMAEVLLAEKQGPGGFGRRVAMKRILPHLAHEKDAIQMFLDEARIAARLHHPNIVQIYDIEEHDRTYYLTMELMSGPSLATWIRAARERPDLLPPSAVAAIADALLEALGHVHKSTDESGRALGLVHRDVKPANVLTSLSGDVKLGDFGIARADFRLYQTAPGQSRGTPSYMAPEALFGQEATPRTDLFAAAAVLFEVLTLEMAFPKGSRKSPLPELPSRLGEERIARLNAFFERALADDPAERFAGAGEMLVAFQTALDTRSAASRRQLAAWLAEIASSSSPTQIRASRQLLAKPEAPQTEMRSIH